MHQFSCNLKYFSTQNMDNSFGLSYFFRSHCESVLSHYSIKFILKGNGEYSDDDESKMSAGWRI